MRASRIRGLRVQLGLVAVVAMALTAGSCASDEARNGDESAFAGEEMAEPVARPSFELTNVESGETFDFQDETEGYVTLLFFGYTHCPDVCPVHMANLAAVLRDLPREVERKIRVVFVSTDPERDTPERIREWLSGHHPSFIGLRGTREEVTAIEKELGLSPSVVQAGEEESDYFVAHGAQVLAFGLDDTARVAYPWGTRQRDWLRDLPKLVKQDY